MFKSLFIASLFLSSVSAFATTHDLSLEVARIEVHRIPNVPLEVSLPATPANPIDEIAMYVDGIIAIGKKIWPIIQAGVPVITTNGFSHSHSVLPILSDAGNYPTLNQMANWSAPKAESYQVVYKNYLNMVLVSFVYTVIYQYNGSYHGVGKYITSLQVQASDIYTLYGQDFSAQTELINVTNAGTDTNPIAAAIIQVSYKIRGREGAQSFYVDGTGVLQSIK